jgi:hypothetical protein
MITAKQILESLLSPTDADLTLNLYVFLTLRAGIMPGGDQISANTYSYIRNYFPKSVYEGYGYRLISIPRDEAREKLFINSKVDEKKVIRYFQDYDRDFRQYQSWAISPEGLEREKRKSGWIDSYDYQFLFRAKLYGIELSKLVNEFRRLLSKFWIHDVLTYSDPSSVLLKKNSFYSSTLRKSLSELEQSANLFRRDFSGSEEVLAPVPDSGIEFLGWTMGDTLRRGEFSSIINKMTNSKGKSIAKPSRFEKEMEKYKDERDYQVEEEEALLRALNPDYNITSVLRPSHFEDDEDEEENRSFYWDVPEAVDYLVNDCWAETDILDNKGRSPLEFAVRAKDYDSMAILLKAGADPNFKLAFDKTALMIACELGYDEVVSTIMKTTLEEIKVNFQDKKGWTALMYAVQSGNLTTLESLIKYKNNRTTLKMTPRTNNGKTALDLAEKFGEQEILELLQEYFSSEELLDKFNLDA